MDPRLAYDIGVMFGEKTVPFTVVTSHTAHTVADAQYIDIMTLDDFCTAHNLSATITVTQTSASFTLTPIDTDLEIPDSPAMADTTWEACKNQAAPEIEDTVKHIFRHIGERKIDTLSIDQQKDTFYITIDTRTPIAIEQFRAIRAALGPAHCIAITVRPILYTGYAFKCTPTAAPSRPAAVATQQPQLLQQLPATNRASRTFHPYKRKPAHSVYHNFATPLKPPS